MRVPANRWNKLAKSSLQAYGAPDHAYSESACLITDFRPDYEGIGLDRSFIDQLDSLFQWVLHASGEALRNCNLDALDKRRVGAILAAIALPTRTSSLISQRYLETHLLKKSGAEASFCGMSAAQAHGGRMVGFPAALVCEVFGLGGSAYTLDAACASSLYALKLACDELQAYRADAMITGGVSGADNLYTQIGFSQLQALSRSGRCAPFDRSADGLLVGEGAGILVLKRLDDALRDRDTIWGVIRGIGLSNDLRGNLLAPESDGQLRAMRAAYREAGWRPWDVDYIECHGAGTPVGDLIETQSLKQLWDEAPPDAHGCAIGSVKSMIGHLLTGAGAAGMIKTLLAMKHETLPPSLKFEQPPEKSPLNGGHFRVQTEPTPWHRRDERTPRRAAVSAFGFGGINGHVLIEEWRPRDLRPALHSTAPSKQGAYDLNAESHDIAIVGMELCLGDLQSREAFQSAVFQGHSCLKPVPENRWRMRDAAGDPSGAPKAGAFLDDVVIEQGEFRIPPGEIPDILPQQLLMLKTAAGAMRDAGLPPGQPRERMGTIIGISFDYEATNFHLRWTLEELIEQWKERYNLAIDPERLPQWIEKTRAALGPPLTATRTLGALGGIVASRIAREFRFGGPSFVVSAEEVSGLRAVEIAMRMLQSRQMDAMLVGAVDLNGDPRNLATLYDAENLSRSGRIQPFDQSADGTLPGEGAVALVLKRLEDAQTDGDRIYAVIKGIAGAHGVSGAHDRGADVYRTSLERAFQDGRTDPAAVGLIECHGSGIPDEDATEANALAHFFGSHIEAPDRAVAIGSLKPLVGNTGAAAGLASLAKAALSLFHHLLPVMPNYTGPPPSLWDKTGFHFPRQTNYWPHDRMSGVRTACVAAMTRDGNCMHTVLCQHEAASAARESHPRRPMGPLPFGLFLLQGQNKDGLQSELERLESLATNSASPPDAVAAIEEFSHIWYQQAPTTEKGACRLSILTHSLDDLYIQIAEARQCIQSSSSRSFGSRGGVSYLAEAEHLRGELAFVFPGSGNHYVGMGRTLGAHFPEVLRAMDRKTDRLHAQMLPHLFDPRRTDWPANWQTESYQALVADPLHTIFGQVIFGGQMARLLKQFKLRPDAAIGYSLGESAGLFALEAWPDHGQMLDRLASSDLFKTELCGPCEALRRTWQIPSDEAVRWRVAVVNRPAAQVDAAIAATPHVRRLIVNTPNECVIGGLDGPVARVIKQLGCEALYLDGVVTVHCDAARPVAQAYKDLHRFPTSVVAGLRFYSCAQADSYALSSETAADSILQQALKGFDFPATIRKAYADGVRVFVEIGPQSSCTRMIRQILGDAPHLAVTVNTRGEDECLSLIKCLGTLAAAGLKIDLATLYAYPQNHFKTRIQVGPNAIRVPVGGPPLSIPPLPLLETALPTGVPQVTGTPEVKPAAQERYVAPVAFTTPTINEAPEPSYSAPSQIEASIQALSANLAATAQAHDQFLDLSREITRQYGQAFEYQTQLRARLTQMGGDFPEPKPEALDLLSPVAFTREQCLAFAIGSVGKVLGPQFDIIDTYKVRVRLPDEPLMLVDRILEVHAEKCSLGSGRIVTEHDVRPGAWYLDGGRAPVCISVEAGQADLFLSSYLGIDHQVKGERAYRLLDAKIRFHRGLPQAGETIRYDIRIDKFVKQGATYLFFFRYEGYIGNEHLITMTEGCAGFFTEQEVRNSGGIILGDEDRAPGTRVDGSPFRPILPLAKAAYDDAQVEALRAGDAAGCFGDLFRGIQLPPALRLPAGRMRLIDRILELAPEGGRWGLGSIRAEADIHPDDWFLTCHFVDDKVMPGTLMYECCAHTLRVLLLRLGWVSEQADACYEPVQQVPTRLKCRGPVTPASRKVHYMVEIKEIGYHPEPYVVADAHMYADGRYIVFFKDMSMQMTGVTLPAIEAFWQGRGASLDESPTLQPERPLFTREQILQYAIGSPSKAFGAPYAVFDHERVIARLPGPPYFFMDRVTAIEPLPWVLKADGWVEAQYDVPADAWYFAADGSGVMPFCVLLEIALQPCGWLAAYAGSALRSKKDLKFRNLGGKAEVHANLPCGEHCLTMRTRLTKVSEAADMIIEDFDFEVLSQGRPIYTGSTNFGFFTAQALSQQVGLRDAHYTPNPDDEAQANERVLDDTPPLLPEAAPKGAIFRPDGLRMPAKALRMIDAIDCFNPNGGPQGLGYIRGHKIVDPDEWFFKAHFFQDPVCPGSLGVESFLQLLKYAALQRWPQYVQTHRFEMVCDGHEWQYRGQILPSNHRVVVDAVITHIEEGDTPSLTADGWLQVDHLYIYRMSRFGLRLVPIH
jgi:PfaB family protein